MPCVAFVVRTGKKGGVGVLRPRTRCGPNGPDEAIKHVGSMRGFLASSGASTARLGAALTFL